MPAWLEALALAVQALPSTAVEIQTAINDHWGKDHVAQIAKGADLLTTVASTIGRVFADRGVPPGPAPVAVAPVAAAPAGGIDYDLLAAAILRAQKKPSA